jgi:hypothetical protein
VWQVREAIIRGAEAYHHTPQQPHLHTPALREAREALEALVARLRANPDLRRETPRGLVREAVTEGIRRAERIERRAGELARESRRARLRDEGRER